MKFPPANSRKKNGRKPKYPYFIDINKALSRSDFPGLYSQPDPKRRFRNISDSSGEPCGIHPLRNGRKRIIEMEQKRFFRPDLAEDGDRPYIQIASSLIGQQKEIGMDRILHVRL